MQCKTPHIYLGPAENCCHTGRGGLDCVVGVLQHNAQADEVVDDAAMKGRTAGPQHAIARLFKEAKAQLPFSRLPQSTPLPLFEQKAHTSIRRKCGKSVPDS